MGFTSFDVELGDLPLMLAVDRQGKQSIDFGLTAREPGPRAEIGSIVMSSFHHGPGQLIANDPRAVKEAKNIDISVPGRVYPAGASSSLFTAESVGDFYWNQGGGSIVVPKQGNPTNAPVIYFVTAKRIYSVDTSNDSVATVYTNPATLAFTGQVARYRDKLFFGREDQNREAATPIVLYLPSETAYEGTGTDMSYVFTAANSVWWVANHGYLTPPDIYWTDDKDFPGDPICATVKYTGNGTAQNVTGVPFQPDVAIAKGDVAEQAVLKTDTMGAAESKLWGTAGLLTTGITGFLSNGFSVGTHDAANKNGVEYVAVCFKKKDGLIDTLTHLGDGVDNRDIETSFSADLAFVAKGAGGTGNAHVVARPSTLEGDNSFVFSSVSTIANAIQELGASKFQLGQDVRVNENGVTYHDIIFKASPNVLALLTYKGNSQDNREVEVGLRSEYAIVKCADAFYGYQRMVSNDSDWSAPFDNAFIADMIQDFGADYIEVGSAIQVNMEGKTYHCMAFGATTSFNKAGPFRLDAGGYCTWLHAVGPFTLPFKADGMIYGMDEYGAPAPFLVHDEGGGTDFRFGHGARMDWRGRLLIPAGSSLKALNFPGLESEDVNPLAQLPGSETSYYDIGPTSAIGSRQAIVLQHDTEFGCFLSREYPDGEFLTPAFNSPDAPCYALEAIRLHDGSYGVYALCSTPLSITVHSKCGEHASYPAINAIDDKIATPWWHPTTCYHWIIFDLQATRTVTKIRLHQPISGKWGLAAGLEVYVSDDPANWGAAVWTGVMGITGWNESAAFSKAGRYIKLVSLSNSSTQFMTEFVQETTFENPARIEKFSVAAIDHTVGPSTENPGGQLQTSLYTGEGLAAGVTKAFLQLRGYAPKGTVENPITLKFRMDGGSAQALGAITGAGPFSIPFPTTIASLGRYLAIDFDPLGDGNLALPLIVDFEHCPAVDDIVTFGFDVRDIAVNALGGITKRRAAHAVQQALADMQGEIKLVKFSDGRPDWTVRVEDVTSQNITRRAFGQGEENLVFVAVKRLA